MFKTLSLLVLGLSTALATASIPRNPDLPKLERPNLGVLPRFFPLNEEKHLAIELKVGEKTFDLEISFKVEEDTDSDGKPSYCYVYTVTNKSDKKMAIFWEVLDKLSGTETGLILKPEESRTLKVCHSKSPVYKVVGIEVWVTLDKNDLKEELTKAKASLDGEVLYPLRGKFEAAYPNGK